MKNFLIASFLLVAAVANAQVKFKPGFRAGVNFAKVTETNLDYRTDFYAGAFAGIQFNKVYTLQPEIGISNQGSQGELSYSQDLYNQDTGEYLGTTTVKQDINIKLNYFTFTALNKFTIKDKVVFMVGPTFDFILNHNERTESDVDLGVTAGVGYTTPFGLTIEARVKKGVADVIEYDYDDDSYLFEDYNTNLVFQIGVSYAFDLK
jgi:hypothetical protein